MFERFTDRARQVVVLAQEEARQLNHNYIGTEHLLLGLLRSSDGVAAQALTSLDVSLTEARQQVMQIIGMGEHAPGGHIPFTPRAKKVLELALREALQLDHNYIGTEHILLGLLREGEGVAAQVLRNLGADLPVVRQKVVELLGSPLNVAGFPPVGSHRVVAAALRDPNSAASRTLAAAGVDIAALVQALDDASVEGTTDERPEDRGRRQLTVQFDGENVVFTAADPSMVAAARELWARWEIEDGAVVAGGEDRAAPLGAAWAALHRALMAMARPQTRSGRDVSFELSTSSVSSMVGRRRRRRRPRPDPPSER